MRKSTKAALLSGLVFPGLGHLVLKQYLRGAILLVAALGALIIMVKAAVGTAMAVVDSIESGAIPVDERAITDAVAASGGSTADLALIVLCLCWLVGIVDSIRIGRKQDLQDDPQPEDHAV